MIMVHPSVIGELGRLAQNLADALCAMDCNDRKDAELVFIRFYVANLSEVEQKARSAYLAKKSKPPQPEILLNWS